ncbi:MAG: hypothetical protein JWM95_3575, partial [Gemmatimonadetes bacterium]|nr:hypothetical protein [Gemmatimonadota bacterium]
MSSFVIFSSSFHVRPALAVAALLFSAACRDAPGKVQAESAKPSGHVTSAPGDVLLGSASSGYSVAPVASPGTVSGTVSLASAITPALAASTGRDSAICGASIPDASVQQQGSNLAGVVVWLDGVHSGKAFNLERRLELESLHCKLSPRVQVAATGSSVNILGHDKLRQHLRFTATGEPAPRANILLGSGEQVIPTDLPFKSAGMVTITDEGHPWTRAYIAVFEHPYFAVTGANGSFSIEGVPPGTYTLRAW